MTSASLVLYLTLWAGLHCIALHSFCVFHKLKVRGKLAWSKSVGAIFPTVLAHFMSLCPIAVILTVFQTFHDYICYGDLSSVILDVTIVIVLGCP